MRITSRAGHDLIRFGRIGPIRPALPNLDPMLDNLFGKVGKDVSLRNFQSILLLRRECCSFSNGEYMKSGLVELEKWLGNITDEFAGTSWHELKYIRQAVGFLVIHQKRKKSLDEIRQDLCPVVAQMRDLLTKESLDLASNSFLLDEDMSIPFSSEDISKAIPAIDATDVELPPHLRELPSAQPVVQRLELPAP
ncbi:hypothetical protein Taro_040449 [Colocasia esculenta]|uniref:Dilute domain-containing protein n=1 Tax=Colocasia esculenta TaxID=4460 RepID=A0A843WLY1_COLES|nr:hypothetical protein [Colocasia esculenta]